MGLLADPETGRRRKVHALIFTAVVSRHMFVHLRYGQRLERVIAGCEAAWAFFGGVFKVLVPENVPRNILRVLWPTRLCGGSGRIGHLTRVTARVLARMRGHITLGSARGWLPRSVPGEGKLPMLEEYFVKPATVDRLRGSWIGAEIERYVEWLVEHGYSTDGASGAGCRSRSRSASSLASGGRAPSASLPAHVEAFVADRVARHDARTAVDAADGQGGPGPCRADALGRARRLRAQRPAAARPAVRRCRARLLRLPGRGAWSSPGLDAGLSPSPRPLRGLPAADRCRVDPELSPAILQRLRRRARRRGAGQEHGARRCRCPAGVPALRPPRGRARPAT